MVGRRQLRHNKFGKIQSGLALLYSLIFLVLGAILNGSFFEMANILAFTIGTSILFLVPVSTIAKQFEEEVNDESEELWIIAVAVILLLVPLYTFVIVRSGVPILSDRVESQRLEVLVRYGPAYRIMNELVFLSGAGVTVFLAQKRIRFRTWSWIFGLLLLVLISLAFRARIFDFILIGSMAYVLAGSGGGGSQRGTGRRVLVVGGIVLALMFVVFLTGLRSSVSTSGAISETVDRAVFLNHRVNLPRIYNYTSAQGFGMGSTYIEDLGSILIPGGESYQQRVTGHFNSRNSRLFTMTPTAYGETYFNFGALAVAFGPAILFAVRIFCEAAMCRLRTFSSSGCAWTAMVLVYLYYVPRTYITGGVTSSIFVKFIALILSFLLVSMCHIAVQVVSGRRVTLRPASA